MNLKLSVLLSLFLMYAVYSFYTYTAGTESINNRLKSQEVINGKLLFQNKNCISCHQIFGLGGYLGPELTNELSQVGKGKTYASAILASGLNKMPNYHLNTTEINSILAYLEDVGKSAKINS